jgi:hypothetical protein
MCMHMTLCGLLLVFLQATPQQVERAFLEGRQIELRFSKPQDKERLYVLGPWKLGPKLRKPRAGNPDKPHDKRLNMYIVVPGMQHQSKDEPAYDHNFLVNAVSRKRREAEYDVFWAITLDPHLTADLRTENELLLAAQERFVPNDLFEFDDLPGAAFLESVLKIHSLTGLRKHRDKKGSFPRVLIVQAGFALRASAAPVM